MIPNSNNFFRREWLLILVLLLPFIALALLWPLLPASVPMHFNSQGHVNRYGSPLELLILPGVNLVVAIVLYFIPRLDPKSANVAASAPAYRWIRFVIAAFFAYIFALVLLSSLDPSFDAPPLIAVGLLAMFLVIGLLMPKLKQNYIIGIRLPWTLESEDNWNRTHAFAGRLWPWGAAVGMVLALLFQSASLYVVMGVLIVIMIWTGIYSYLLFRKEKGKD